MGVRIIPSLQVGDIVRCIDDHGVNPRNWTILLRCGKAYRVIDTRDGYVGVESLDGSESSRRATIRASRFVKI